MTPFEVFSFWKFPWKYDLLWRQKLQKTGISSRFPAVSTVSDALHPTSRAEKYPRPLIFSFCASFFGERVSTPKLPQQNAFWVELEPILHLRTSMWGRAKGNFQWKCVFPMEIPAESQGSPSGNRVVEINPSRAGNVRKGQSTSSATRRRPPPTSSATRRRAAIQISSRMTKSSAGPRIRRHAPAPSG